MVILGAVCLTAFVVIPTLWWSRGQLPGVLGTEPGLKVREKVSFARGPGIYFRETGTGALEPIISRAV